MADLLSYIDFSTPEIPHFREIVIFLIASITIVPLFQRLKASPVLGYLAAGMIIGPFGMRLVRETADLEMLADLGVVFLLFMIGLKLSFERLMAMRRYVFGLGILQVVITGSIAGATAYAWGNSAEVSILLGACFAMSSTAIVSQILMERDELLTHKGRVTISILLAQDLAVVPLLVMVNVFGESGGQSLGAEIGITAIKAACAIAIILLAGRLLMRPLFRIVNTSSQSPELFVGLCLLVILLTSALTNIAGLSMELGAFMAGLLLAETEYHNRIENDIRPFQGLLLGLFFITVGMGIDANAVLGSLFWLIASVLGLFILKAAVIAGLGHLFGIEKKIYLPAATLLGQSGEFLYVVVGAAMASKLMPADVGHFMLLVTALSMIATPLFAAFSDWLEKRLAAP